MRQCLRNASGRPELASGLDGMTVIWVAYRGGEVSDVSIRSSSGNDALDRFAADCFKAQPPDPERAKEMERLQSSLFPIAWRQVVLSPN